MATITGMTADRMLAIEAASVVDGDVVGDNLILTKHDGTQINAGSVKGPAGPQGPVGSDLAVLAAVPILDVGLANQIRAGHQLTAADFTNMGLSAPVGLWNLSDLSDVSGNGRNLNNKGAIPFAAGINGTANTAAQFSGAVGQALYIPDSGAADSLRIKTGSWGCWFRTAKRGVINMLVDKYGTANQQCFSMYTGSANLLGVGISQDGAANNVVVVSVSDVSDDRWHFGVATYDGITIKVYVDCVLEGAAAFSAGPIFSGSSAFNIGSRGADAGTNGVFPNYGRVDETFVTSDVLSEEQIRNLYCAKIPHILAAVPTRLSLNIRRRKKGSVLVPANFSTQPVRLHNFSGGSLGDEGSGGVALTADPNINNVAGVDGSSGNAKSFSGASSLYSNDTGLPSGLATRSYGCWFKTLGSGVVFAGIMGWGTVATGDARITLNPSGSIRFASGADFLDSASMVVDGQWHHAIAIEDNTAIDGVKRKLYVDGRLSAISTVMNPVVLAGVNHFRIAAAPDGTLPFNGQIDSVFICNYALTSTDVATLYAKGSQELTPSPKSVGDHVEAMDATSLLVTFDTLESQHTVDLKVAV